MRCCRVEDPSLIWEEVMQLGIKNWGNKALRGLVCRLVFGLVVYNIWRNRKMKLRILVNQILKNRLSRSSFEK
jgi:hypothetical protein